MTAARLHGHFNLPALAAISAGLCFVALQVVAAALAGAFEYPLDDVYIHLAMAGGIAGGTYGVNAGEAASASSSILYPLLLVPFSGSEAQRYLPLFWNALAVVAEGWLWGRVVVAGAFAPATGRALALVGPLALNMAGVGFTGMENSLHAAVALATVLGLRRFLQTGALPAWFAAAVIAGPLLRPEALALSGLVVLVLIAHGRKRYGLVLGHAALAPVVAFAGFLVWLGLPVLPGSLLLKLGISGSFGVALGVNLSKQPGILLAFLTLLCAVLPLLRPVARHAEGRLLLWVLAAAGAAHLAFGQIGWMHRYEHYIIVAQTAGLVIAGAGAFARLSAALTSVVLALAGLAFWPILITDYVWNPRAVQLQQAQMARFAQQWLDAPVAVNDLGRVAWRNPNYVLDIYGLGSAEALALRRQPVALPTGWAGELAAAHGVRLAMIYDSWFGDAVGPEWLRIAELTQVNPRGRLGDWTVSFYATRADAAAALVGLLADFAQTLPTDAKLTLLPRVP